MSEHVPIRIGPYLTSEVLGRGGMGIVYRARDVQTGEIAALKTVLVPEESLLTNIRREILALSKVRHPGIVRILHHGLHEGMPWYAMELIEGTTLRHYVRGGSPSRPTERQDVGATRPFPEAVAHRRGKDAHAGRVRLGSISPEDLGLVLRLTQKICAPLAFLHGEGIVHRDVKPENIVVESNGQPRLVDFGLMARFATTGSRDVVEISGGVSGTAAYMAPEQGRGDLVDARADLYALGCVLFELLTGQPPFPAASPIQVLWRHLQDTPDSPSKLVAGVPEELDKLILGLLAKEPRERLGHADDLARMIRGIALECALPAPPGSGWDDEPEGPAPRAFLYRPSLTGRGRVMGHLRDYVARLKEGHGAMVLVSGESGVGKTRLCTEAISEAKRAGFTVLVGECLPAGEGAGLQSLRRPLEAIADRCRERGPRETSRILGDRAPLLARYCPAIEGLGLVSQSPEDLPSDAARMRLSSYLVETFVALASDEPALLCLDDLQWADDLTLSFLDLACRGRHLEDAPLLILGTLRTEEACPLLEDLAKAVGCDRITLERLDPPAVREILREMLATDPPDPLVGILARLSEGNPFFVAEYVRLAIDNALLTRDEGGRWCAGGGGLDPGAFEALPDPSSIVELMRRRLDGLPPPSQAVLSVAAVLGREASCTVMALVAKLHDEALMEALLPLEKRHILEAVPGGRLRFSHDKLREAAYEMIDPLGRSRLHGMAARALEALHPDLPPEILGALGGHWEAAGEPLLARARYLSAADHALTIFALEQAERLLLNGLRLFPSPTKESIAARKQLASMVYVPAGRLDEALRHAEAGLEEALLLGDLKTEVSGLHNLAAVLWKAVRLDEARAIADRAITRARELPDPREALRAQGTRALIVWDQGELDEAGGTLRDVLEKARALGDRSIALDALQGLAGLHRARGDAGEAMSLLEETLGLAREQGSLPDVASIIANLGVLEAEEGVLDSARGHFEEALALFRKMGNKRSEAVQIENLGNVERDLGNFPRALALLKEARALARATASAKGEALIGMGLADVLWEMGEVHEVLPLLDECLVASKSLGEIRERGRILRELAMRQRMLGRFDLAKTHLQEAIATLERLKARRDVLRARCEEGHLALAQGQPVAAILERVRALAADLQPDPKSTTAWIVGKLETAAAASAKGEPLQRGEHPSYLSDVVKRRLPRQ